MFYRIVYMLLDLLISIRLIPHANLDLLLASNDALMPVLPLFVVPLHELEELSRIFQEAGSGQSSRSQDVAQAADGDADTADDEDVEDDVQNDET